MLPPDAHGHAGDRAKRKEQKNDKSGEGGHRSRCLFVANEALYHLSYSPDLKNEICSARQAVQKFRPSFHTSRDSLQVAQCLPAKVGRRDASYPVACSHQYIGFALYT